MRIYICIRIPALLPVPLNLCILSLYNYRYRYLRTPIGHSRADVSRDFLVLHGGTKEGRALEGVHFRNIVLGAVFVQKLAFDADVRRRGRRRRRRRRRHWDVGDGDGMLVIRIGLTAVLIIQHQLGPAERIVRRYNTDVCSEVTDTGVVRAGGDSGRTAAAATGSILSTQCMELALQCEDFSRERLEAVARARHQG